MSDQLIAPNSFRGVVACPTSKSHANRHLIMAALSKEIVTLHQMPSSSDVIFLVKSLEKIGLKIVRENAKLIVLNSFPECEEDGDQTIILETGDGGTTNRFLIPLLALGKRKYQINPSEELKKRPHQELVSALKNLDVQFDDPYTFQGPITSSPLKLKVDSSRSSQFASALLMISTQANFSLVDESTTVSQEYYNLTKKIVSDYQSGKREFFIPADFSAISYPLALGVASHKVTRIPNCFEKDFFQTDAQLIDLIGELGGAIEFSKEGLLLAPPKKNRAFDKECSSCPDLVPTLAFIASCAQGVSHLTGLGILKHKESDRYTEICKLLALFGIKLESDSSGDTLIITGGSTLLLNQVIYDAPKDHRMIMTAALFMEHHSGGIIKNAEYVEKSFPNFFTEMFF